LILILILIPCSGTGPDAGQEIVLVHEKGQPIPNRTGWTLGFVTEKVALFTDGQNDMSVRGP
jgi:hypothetical protein